MKEERNQFLRLLGQIPARLTAEQVAWVLNCQPHDGPILPVEELDAVELRQLDLQAFAMTVVLDRNSQVVFQ